MSSRQKRARSENNPWLASAEVEQLTATSAVYPEVRESVELAGHRLRSLLIEKHVAGEMPANLLCAIAWWHTKSGGRGLSDIALDPGKSNNGNCNAHVSLVLGREYTSPDLYYFQMPSYDKVQCRRVMTTTPIRLPPEVLADDFTDVVDGTPDPGESEWGTADT